MRARYPHEPTSDLAAALGRGIKAVYQRATTLALKKTAAYLAGGTAGRIHGGYTPGAKRNQYRKGHVPANKGLRRPGWGPGRMKATQFKPGVRQGVAVKLYKPIGSERVSKDGYLERKIHDGMPRQSRWRAVHLVLWESERGPVPQHHAICFVNGNKADIRIENLVAVPRGELMRRNSVHNLPAPLPQTIQLLGALRRQIRKRDGKEQDRRSA